MGGPLHHPHLLHKEVTQAWRTHPLRLLSPVSVFSSAQHILHFFASLPSCMPLPISFPTLWWAIREKSGAIRALNCRAQHCHRPAVHTDASPRWACSLALQSRTRAVGLQGSQAFHGISGIAGVKEAAAHASLALEHRKAARELSQPARTQISVCCPQNKLAATH